MAREVADPSQLTDDDVGLANVILTNGARLYVDHAHPEYSSPEVSNALAGTLWDKAGELIMATAAQRAANMPGGQRLNLYKNNTDNKGASYGTHENYLMERATPFTSIVRHLTPFFITRQIMCGQGRVGIGQQGREAGYQISQRADFFEVEVGLETTLKRPIINTRDEPHADAEKYRRLHVIIGDANLSEVATFLKLGTTSIVFSMIEQNFLEPLQLAVERPISELHAVSHDTSLQHLLTLRDGRTHHRRFRCRWSTASSRASSLRTGSGQTRTTSHLTCLRRWELVLDALATDPQSLANQLDWVAKMQLLEGYRARDGLDWSDARLELVDLQYSDVRPDKGLYYRLVAKGRMERLLDEQRRPASR